MRVLKRFPQILIFWGKWLPLSVQQAGATGHAVVDRYMLSASRAGFVVFSSPLSEADMSVPETRDMQCLKHSVQKAVLLPGGVDPCSGPLWPLGSWLIWLVLNPSWFISKVLLPSGHDGRSPARAPV